jgi:predicted secreted hydrolase
MLFHGALTDLGAGRLSFFERTCRAYPPWAHAATDTLDVMLLDATLLALPDTSGVSVAPGAATASLARLRCRAGDGVLDLQLDLASCAPLLHGVDPGLSLKGHEPGQASWYYSLPRIAVRGTLQRPADGAADVPDDGAVPLAVSGHAWFDHEFGSSQLSAGQAGWDWFSVALDDGTDLMLYRMRLAGGGADETSSGTLRTPDGARTHLRRQDFVLTETAAWTSPATGTWYPGGWQIAVPAHGLELTVVPALADQELRTPGSTGVTYWEGLSRFSGTRAGQPVRGEGYVELVGYDRRFLERL